MALKTDPRMAKRQLEFEEEPRTGKLEREDDDGRRRWELENDDLRRQLQEREQHAGLLAEKVMYLHGDIEPGMFLLMAAGLVGGRTALLAFVDLRFPILMMAVNAFYGLLGLLVVGKWLLAGWKEQKWMLIPSFVIVFDAVLAGAAMIWGGVPHPLAATIVIVVAFLFVVGHGCDAVLPWLLHFLRSPKLVLKGKNDKRRKD